MALRVTPAHDWRQHRQLAPEVWLVGERDVGDTPQTKYFFVHLPATASWTRLVRFAHQRWAIEQQYRELKTNLGLDHFEGRTFPGWHHHVVLTAITYNFLQAERRRHLAGLTFPAAHAIVQEIFTAYLFAQRPHYLKRKLDQFWRFLPHDSAILRREETLAETIDWIHNALRFNLVLIT